MDTMVNINDVRQLQLINPRYGSDPSFLVEPVGDPMSDPDDVREELGPCDTVAIVEDALAGWWPYNVILCATTIYADYDVSPTATDRYYLAVVEHNQLFDQEERWWDNFLADTESVVEAVAKLQQYEDDLRSYRNGLRGQFGVVSAKMAEYVDVRIRECGTLIDRILDGERV